MGVYQVAHSHWAEQFIKVDWLAACIALRIVGAVLVVVLWRWRKICTIRQPMGNKGRYLKKSTQPCSPVGNQKPELSKRCKHY
jgi:hypothetical protein